MPMRPWRTGVKSCFSLASVLKTRNGMELFYQSRRGPCGALAAARCAAVTLHDPAGGDRPADESAVEDGLQIALDVVLVDALGQRELLDQEIPRRIEHLALAEAQILVELEQIEVAQHLRDLEHGAGLDLLHVLPVAAVPSGGVEGGGLSLWGGGEHVLR